MRSPVSLRSLRRGPRPVTAPLADGAGALGKSAPDRAPVDNAMRSAIDLEKLLAVERATVEKGTT